MLDDQEIAALRRAIEALGQSENPDHRVLALAAGDALWRLKTAENWRTRLLADETVEAVAGELFAQDATEAIRDSKGGWSKDRLRRAARSLLAVAVETISPEDGRAPGDPSG